MPSEQQTARINRSEFTSSIRPLTAAEYKELLEEHGYELRVSDGTAEGTWRFWTDHGRLFYRRLSWTQNKMCDTDFMQNIIDGDGMTQLIAGDSDA